MSASMSKSGKITVSGTATVDVDFDEVISLDELDDDQLMLCVEEARKRGLSVAKPLDKEVLGEIQHDLILRRHDRAKTRFFGLLFKEEDRRTIFDAWEALEAGRFDEAIVLIDHYINPSPARNAASIPMDLRPPKPKEEPLP